MPMTPEEKRKLMIAAGGAGAGGLAGYLGSKYLLDINDVPLNILSGLGGAGAGMLAALKLKEMSEEEKKQADAAAALAAALQEHVGVPADSVSGFVKGRAKHAVKHPIMMPLSAAAGAASAIAYEQRKRVDYRDRYPKMPDNPPPRVKLRADSLLKYIKDPTRGVFRPWVGNAGRKTIAGAIGGTLVPMAVNELNMLYDRMAIPEKK